MALDPRKRQKKLQKKNAKRKAAVVSKKQKGMVGTARQIAFAANAPIHECIVPSNLFEAGIGNIIVSRQLPHGQLAVAFFLLDVFCLGVKDAFFQVMSVPEYTHKLQSQAEFGSQQVEPAYARKLVEDAVAYARSIGLSPHADYRSTQQIFGDIDIEDCTASFEFGKDGKPFYVSGPHDSESKSKRIVNTLAKTCGPDVFDYIVALNPFDEYEEDSEGVTLIE
jgi:hypothetical protein